MYLNRLYLNYIAVEPPPHTPILMTVVVVDILERRVSDGGAQLPDPGPRDADQSGQVRVQRKLRVCSTLHFIVSLSLLILCPFFRARTGRTFPHNLSPPSASVLRQTSI